MKNVKEKIKLLIIKIDMLWIHLTGMYTGTHIRVLDNDFPYFTKNATEWLNKFLTPQMKVFEWGSGSSTIFFAKRVSQIFSIEYNKTWASKMKWYMWLKDVKNCQLFYVPSEKNQMKGDIKNLSECRSTSPTHQDETYRNYVNKITKFQTDYFDIIVVDGRARPSCLVLARKYVRVGGYIILDDSEREAYIDACKFLQNDFTRTDFPGQDIYYGFDMMTSIFERMK
jgi:hypothetical protein